MVNLFDSYKKYWPVLILGLLIIPSIWFLLLPGFFESDDGEWMVIRFSAFYQAFADGQFPVRFLGRLNHGYGYPVSNFLYPGFMYFAVPIHVLGLNFVNAIKAILIFSMAGTAVFAYFWLSRIFDKFSAAIGSLVLTYTPYHLFDLYKRGSVGELFAFVWVSFTLLAIEQKNIFFISIGVFLLAISHNTIFLLFAPLLFAYSLIRKTLNFKDTAISFVFGILMSSFFTIPALYELQFTNFAATKISNLSEYFVGFNLIGLSSVFIMALSLLVFLKFKRKDSLFVLFFFISVASILLSQNASEPIWNILPSQLVQFPFRLLSYLIFGAGFLAAFAAFYLKKQKLITSGFILALLVFSSYNYIVPEKRVFKDDSFYFTNEATTTVQDEYMPKWVKEEPVERYKEKVQIVRGGGEIKNLIYNDSKNITFDVETDDNSNIRINTIYYPGFGATINGKESRISYDNPNGVMELEVGPGENKIEATFGESPIRLVSDLISLVSFVGLLGWTIRRRNKND
ncbi:MAG: hypothetical protein A3C30_00810 [Candidatus Levybacteria bacterium RIFCSPHIGHO2_02_FULL_40_18]|nr:MAG: hypothetical protein A2869_03120 [Candidatus Levybacteria bacterium RIFCSPHIGHO2_01_FULL_40_58]OGH27240.1 MAG: hypothetical protein A3C30_00810 [Candidatus Levybacteria bacterium RIFCSPHIGHO2_02_FULL_40_18]OGH31099.1 MAG: hypothetical protein A3E43_05225 [Candidatus Levybacteria bacterium RIFCSPHIGHO2_12_FULL_40_31]OGH40733.1 MAG: hypothetical protein A2894_03215 [Candidatus Levybacteria bacterium RIFCSPLOWO2_01_FULL_40_64]OGH49372.1 MAG: hypothetical protein A3I54_01855 [Candidatus Lev